MTDWVTIRIKEDVRSDAQDDDRTYTEIMRDGLECEHRHTNTQSDTQSVNTDEIVEELKNQLSMANEPGAEVDVEELINEIDKLKRLVEKVPERTAEEVGSKYA